MTKEKQIEEMANALEKHTWMSQFQAEIASRTLYQLGYRKQRECVWVYKPTGAYRRQDHPTEKGGDA